MLAAFLPIRGRIVVVIGGGPVGRRRATLCLAQGADVAVIDPVVPEDSPFVWRRRTWVVGDIERAFLVFACVSTVENAKIVDACRTAKVLVSSSDSESPGDIVLPAVVERGPLQIAISTGGTSPSLARRLRERLETDFDPTWTDYVYLLGRMRSHVLTHVADAERRTAILRQFSEGAWLDVVRSQGAEMAEILMRATIDEIPPPAE